VCLAPTAAVFQLPTGFRNSAMLPGLQRCCDWLSAQSRPKPQPERGCVPRTSRSRGDCQPRFESSWPTVLANLLPLIEARSGDNRSAMQRIKKAPQIMRRQSPKRKESEPGTPKPSSLSYPSLSQNPCLLTVPSLSSASSTRKNLANVFIRSIGESPSSNIRLAPYGELFLRRALAPQQHHPCA
jgi:hypothetical protein